MRTFSAGSTAAIIALATVAGSAADISGKWTAPFQEGPGRRTLTIAFQFAVHGDQLTGAVEYPVPLGETEKVEYANMAILEGKVNGDRIVFKHAYGYANLFNCVYRGTVSSDGNTIEFTRFLERRPRPRPVECAGRGAMLRSRPRAR